jgi:DNA repair exonuclease SbcCD ATPase subunit
MSDETVVETDGVTVSKFFNAEDFPVPAVAFDIDSDRDDAVTLRIVDEIPDEFGIDQIGFHPEYGSEHWTASGDGVVRFEREIEPGESFTTVYGVRMEEGQDETPFLSAPTIKLEGEDIDEVVPPESTSVVRELAGGERETVPGLEEESEEVGLEADIEGGIESLEEEDAEILEGDVDLGSDEESAVEANEEPVDVEDETFEEEPPTEPEAEGYGAEQPEPSAAEEEEIEEPEAEGFGEEEAEAEAEAEAESAPESIGFDASDLVATLAEAIRNDEVSDDDLATLQDAFGGVPNSTQVEIEHLQSRVSELEAYTDALEEFLDEEGTAQQLVSDVENEVSSLSAELGDLSNEVAEVEASVEDAAGDREQLRERVAAVEDDVGAVEDLREDLERLRGDVDAIDERLADTEDAVMEVDEIEDDLEDVAEDLEDVEEHVDEIEEWRDQLSDVFGT